MALTSRARLGPFEILAPLGVGGMESCIAREAIKILPAQVWSQLGCRAEEEMMLAAGSKP